MKTVTDQGNRLWDARVIGRVLLETQDFDHPAAREYVRHEATYLGSTGAPARDSEWRDRLHLLMTFLAESDRRPHHKGRLPTAVDIFRQMTEGDSSRRASLFQAFADYDPAAALRLAEAVNLDLAEQAPSVLVACAESDVFVDVTMARLDDMDAALRWCCLLALGGLSDPRLAKNLMERVSEARMNAVLDYSAPEGKWRGLGDLVKGRRATTSTLYTYCLELLISSNMSEAQSVLPAVVRKRMALLRSLRPSAKVVQEWVAETFAAILITGSALALSFLVVETFSSIAARTALLTLTLCASYFLFSAVLGYFQLRQRIYAYASGLESVFRFPAGRFLYGLPWAILWITRPSTYRLLSDQELPSGGGGLEFLDKLPVYILND